MLDIRDIDMLNYSPRFVSILALEPVFHGLMARTQFRTYVAEWAPFPIWYTFSLRIQHRQTILTIDTSGLGPDSL